MNVAYYIASIPIFRASDPQAILGEMTAAHGFALELSQRDAWLEQITVLRSALRSFQRGHILFEFVIPRIGKRADVVLYLDGFIAVLEFKVGSVTFDRQAMVQVHDYALDMKNFHLGSHHLPIAPILIATRAKPAKPQVSWAQDWVATPILATPDQLAGVLATLAAEVGCAKGDFHTWANSGYQPTPTIVEAAQALFQAHGVENIARSDAGARNLGVTSECIAAIIEHAKANRRKAICLITGVPGAGKTLAGLNIAAKRSHEHSDEHAVFLSGNGPLVEVLREALARDESAREKTSKLAAHRKVASFIQNIHHFRDESLRDQRAPHEKVVVFDEAQRAWTKEQASKFMRAKRRINDFDMSEPEFLISVMDRHEDWCVIVCLIGGGQEINTGEAGLGEWLSALKSRFTNWDVYVSSRLVDASYVSDEVSADLLKNMTISEHRELHLAVSMRSFRAEAVSSLVSHIVENRPGEARAVYTEVKDRYPIWLTRDLSVARQWLRQHARGSERFGVLAPSGGHRLKPEGIHVKSKIDAPTWFLNAPSDVRSSFYCEDVATEFDVQGLELDWSCVCWDADFRHVGERWANMNFRGTRWQNINSAQNALYLKNAYRVLLTRARQGMIIFIPGGDIDDATRLPGFYDRTFEFLQNCGLRLLSPTAIVSTLRVNAAGG